MRRLRDVPSLSLLLPIAKQDKPGLSAGAVRIRAERIAGLYPRHGTATLAGATVLRFAPVQGAAKYRIEVQDRHGTLVFAAETADSPVRLPPGALQPGRRYDWTVRTLERAGPVAQGDESFATLPAQQAAAREALRQALEKEGSAGALALLAEIDRSLGLLAEAHEELRAAAQASPGDTRLAAELAELERQLSDDLNSPLLAAPPAASEAAGCPFSAPGVVVEAVTPESAAARAGLMPGDRLFSWCRASGTAGDCVARGELRTPFDWLDLQIEDVQRGGVVAAGARGLEARRWSLLPTTQGITVAPL